MTGWKTVRATRLREVYLKIMTCVQNIYLHYKSSVLNVDSYYLGNDSLSCFVVLEEEVVSLDEELAGVFFHLCHPLFPL